ncbi:MAG: hypothetical protein H6Q73_1298 [Firmicutes bacterium]|nr:hypothetical protein [Bacillota bacterium]
MKLKQVLLMSKKFILPLLVILVIITVAQIIISSKLQSRHEKLAEEKIIAQETIQKEYNNLSPLPDATLVNSKTYDIDKSLKGHIDFNYLTDKPWEDIRDFYLNETSKNGWQITKLEETKTKKSINFSKGKYNLNCAFDGNDRTYTLSFRFVLN